MARIVVAGGSGFLGTALVAALRARGDKVIVLARHPTGEGQLGWSPASGDSRLQSALDGADVVVNLAGTSIAGWRWTKARKAAIRDSRLAATSTLVQTLARVSRPSPTFISASAVGFYGDRGSQRLTESSSAGSGFLSDVAREWEQRALEASPTSRVVLLRTGMVLASHGGALPQMALPFKLFVGGPMGSGRQFMSWIHLDDWVAMVLWAIATKGVSGPVNLTAPHPVTNAEFARTLGRALGRPALLPTPALALRLLLGEMAALILEGQRVVPQAALDAGFVFRYPRLEEAIRGIYA